MATLRLDLVFDLTPIATGYSRHLVLGDEGHEPTVEERIAVAQLIGEVAPELQALSDAIVMRGPAYITSKLKKRPVPVGTV